MTKTELKRWFLYIALAAGLTMFALPVQATTLPLDFNYEFSGAYEPEGTAPWLNATFDDGDTPGSVTLTMSDINLLDGEHVKLWAFNLDPTLDPTDLTITYSAGLEAVSYGTGTNFFKADGDGYYDILFTFPKSGNRFGPNDFSVYLISGIDSLTAESFNWESSPGGGAGTYLSAAHVGGIGDEGNNSGWIAPGNTPVPEPATMLLLGSGLVCLAGVGRKRKSQKA